MFCTMLKNEQTATAENIDTHTSVRPVISERGITMRYASRFQTHHLIGLFISGALMFAATTTSLVHGQESRKISKTIAFAKDGRVSIKAYKGSIEIKTWDQAQADIQVRVEADGPSRREEEAVALTEIRIDESRDRLYIASDYEEVKNLRTDRNWNVGINLPQVHYIITLPQSAQLDIEDHKSEITVSGLKASVRINTHKGPTTIRDITGDLRIDTHKARIIITGLNGSLELNTHKSEVEVEFVNLTRRTRIETYKGEINITLPEEARFDLDADVGRNVDFRSDFEISDLERRKGRRGRDLEYRGAVNGGGPLLSLHTDKGYYRIRRQ